MLEISYEEFAGVFENEAAEQSESAQANKRPEHQIFVTDCQVDTDLELLFPDSYISNVSERVRLYRELDNTENEEALQKFESQLIDRFGPIPGPTSELLNIVRLRRVAKRLGFEKVIIKNDRMIIHFVSNQMSPYYQSPTFDRILRFVQRNPQVFQMKETKEKLTMSAENITSIQEAMVVLVKLENTQ